jgi:hypothetical protein
MRKLFGWRTIVRANQTWEAYREEYVDAPLRSVKMGKAYAPVYEKSRSR